MTSHRYQIISHYDTGSTFTRWCDTPETAEELANHLLGCQTNTGTIIHTQIIHNGQMINEWEY